MADIQQAAQWMREGKKVKRSKWEPTEPEWVCIENHTYGIRDDVGCMFYFTTNELLAEDWEIAE